MARYTAFCQEANGQGTIWIETIEVPGSYPPESVAYRARETCAEAWGYDIEDVHCLGLAHGDVSIAYWDDLNC